MIRKEKQLVPDNNDFHEAIKHRIIFDFNGNENGPTILFIGGMHGNEPAGSLALQKVGKELENLKINGRVIGINGNLKALRMGERYITQDLNRIWIPDNIKRYSKGKLQLGENPELDELIEIHAIIDEVLKRKNNNLYFIDLHTTSSATVPFITLNDSINNRQFCKRFALPIVLGIEEVLKGPMLSYINDLGYVAMAFEAGSHNDVNSILHHEAFIWLSLVYTKCLARKDVTNFKEHQQRLTKTKTKQTEFYEVLYRYGIEPQDEFEMEPGFSNFQPVNKNQIIASYKGGKILSDKNANIFMPLYQRQGNDGFFMIKLVSKFWLNLSKRLRKYQFDKLLLLLPGVRQAKANYYSLEVNTNVAKFLTKEVFHLLGYRKKSFEDKRTIYTKRDFQPRRKVY